MWNHERRGRKRVHGVIPNVGTIKEEEVDLSGYEDFGDAVRAWDGSWTTSTIASGFTPRWGT